MYDLLQHDLKHFEIIFEKIQNKALQYLHHIDKTPTSSTYQLNIQNILNEEGIGTLKALKEFNERLAPCLVASSGPRYFGFVTGGTTPAAIAGDWLTSIYDQNTQATKGYGDVSAQIEVETIQLLLDLFQLPKKFLGGFVSGATMSNFSCLAVARQWYGKQLQQDIAKNGLSAKINIFSATPHSSPIKSLAMLGIGSKNFITVKTIDGNREAICLIDLENKIKALEGEPFILVTSAGTVNTADFDDFKNISKLKEKYNFWWHIDAAFGGFVSFCDEYKHLVTDWQYADSITIDCHKWLNVPYESGVFLIQEKHKQLQVETFQNSNAPYLGNVTENFNYLNLLPENSRRMKALPVWFTLKAYGKNGYRQIVENCIKHAKELGNFIESHAAFELLAPVRLNIICFTLANPDSGIITQFLNELNSTGIVFMTPTYYKGRNGLRAALVNYRTTSSDIELVKNLMKEIAHNIFNK